MIKHFHMPMETPTPQNSKICFRPKMRGLFYCLFFLFLSKPEWASKILSSINFVICTFEWHFSQSLKWNSHISVDLAHQLAWWSWNEQMKSVSRIVYSNNNNGFKLVIWAARTKVFYCHDECKCREWVRPNRKILEVKPPKCQFIDPNKASASNRKKMNWTKCKHWELRL